MGGFGSILYLRATGLVMQNLLPTILSRSKQIYLKREQTLEDISSKEEAPVTTPEILEMNLVQQFVKIEEIGKDKNKSLELINNVEKCIIDQIENLDRKDFINKSISNSKLIFFDNKEDAVEFINQYAPEHYIINVQDESFFIDNIVSAGSVFIGNYTPESAGDYASGTNHTLPTNGNAKQYSGVNLDSFLKTITFQKISKEGLLNISKTVETMADAEGLQAHKNAVSIRVKDLNN